MPLRFWVSSAVGFGSLAIQILWMVLMFYRSDITDPVMNNRKLFPNIVLGMLIATLCSGLIGFWELYAHKKRASRQTHS